MYKRDKNSLREIAKGTGLSRNTIRKGVRDAKEGDEPEYRRKTGAGKLTARSKNKATAAATVGPPISFESGVVRLAKHPTPSCLRALRWVRPSSLTGAPNDCW